MAQQWASASDEDRRSWQQGAAPDQVPRPRRRADLHSSGTDAPQSPRGRRAVRSQRSHGLVVLLLLGVPLVGALVDEAIAPGLSLIFDSCAVAGTAAATALAGRAGWWWVLPSSPPVVLGVTAGAELLGDAAKYQGSKALAAGAARWSVNGFPVMLAALGAAVVVLIRISRDKRNRRG